MFETGLAIFLGLVFIFIKLKRRTMLRLLRHDMAIDVAVTLLTVAIHWGTFSGVMAATIGAGIVSIVISFGRWFVGYNTKTGFHPGVIDITAQRTAS